MTRSTKTVRHSRSRFGNVGRKAHVGRKAQGSRRGAAVVELAVCLPVLVLIVFGSIEASSYIFLKQSLNVAAYEAARQAIRVEGDNATADASARNILNSRRVQNFQIRFPNGESSRLDRGEVVTVQITAPAAANSPLLGQFIQDRLLTSQVVMVRQ